MEERGGRESLADWKEEYRGEEGEEAAQMYDAVIWEGSTCGIELLLQLCGSR